MNNIFPEDENREVLQRMQNSGDDLSKPRDVDFSIVFLDERSAIGFIEIVRDEFSKIVYCKVDDESHFPWDVTATKIMAPNYDEISKTEQFLMSVSDRFGGKIDGWGCFSM